MFYQLQNNRPQIHPNTYVAPSADLIGSVILKENSSIWFQAVLRADESPIIIGEFSNVQDGVVIHTDKNRPTIIGKQVTIGHRAIVHAATVGDGSLIGMGAIVLSGCHIGQSCLIAAGCLVPEGLKVPDYSVVMGVPGKIVKQLSEKLAARLLRGSDHYVEMVEFYRQHCQSI
ncbi:MAG: gamma carbonic anhydrase family protein [Spirochaetia bacterium]